jgi:glycosyltransferase involved in cell wall biosynthesis
MESGVPDGPTRVAVIVPAFNEEACIKETIDRLRTALTRAADCVFDIICVNDGSTDRTGEILASLPGLTVITHEVNRGYGAALQTGVEHSAHDWIFIVDADGTYDLDDLPRLIAEAGPRVEMVVGARAGEGISGAPFRRLARWILRGMVRALSGVTVPDLNSGMRIFRRGLYEEFRHLLPLGFSFTTTLTVASLYSGYHVRYVPTAYKRRIGTSTIRPIRDFIGFVSLLVRLASYFEPLKFFVPTSLALFVVAILRAIRDLLVVGYIGNLAIIFFVLSFQVIVVGILADVVVRRSKSGPSMQNARASQERRP